jgi:hypothetical protein
MEKRVRLIERPEPETERSSHVSELRVRPDATPPPSGWAPAEDRSLEGTPTPDYQGRTRGGQQDAVAIGYASQVSEIRRLYAEGEVEAALDLASMVRPSTMSFSLHSVPVVVLTPSEVLALPLDARSGFLLARIDGESTLQMLLDVSPMPAGDTIALLEELLSLGAVRLLPPPVADP